MFGKALEILIVTTLKNHVYQFNNQLRIQRNGGPIGLKLTGEVADCVMVEWDKKLNEKLKKVDIKPLVYTRFKDDITVITESVEKGTKLVDGELVMDDHKKMEDERKTDAKVTMDIIVEIANSIDPMIKLTTETPCNFEDEMLPILDVKARINKEECNRVDFEFFEKQTKNSKVILASSALNWRTKRTILTQECLRRLRNTKVELGITTQRKYLNEFMIKLMNSGYDKKFRIEIVNSTMNAFEKILEEDKNETKPLYRSRLWNHEERIKSKDLKKQNWWKNEKGPDYKSLLMVPPTPGGVLVKDLTEREKELNKSGTERMKIVESGGIQVKSLLVSKNPFKSTTCTQKWCPLCKKSDMIDSNYEKKNVPCNTNNIGYRWICELCETKNSIKVYEGETSRSGRIRAKEHIAAFKNKKSDSVLYKHSVWEHRNEKAKFRFEITGKYKDALSRQANEAVRINSRPNSELLNSKSEFNHPPVARIMVEKSKKKPPTKQNQKCTPPHPPPAQFQTSSAPAFPLNSVVS